MHGGELGVCLLSPSSIIWYQAECGNAPDGHLPEKPGKVGKFNICHGKSGKLWFACDVIPRL